jgi:uncharacterized protein (TIGR02996 family)
MIDEAALIQVILSTPHDDAPRLIYADWLEERGDCRGEYLRVQCQLARTWSYENQPASLLARAAELRRELDPAWLALMRRCTTPPPPVDVAQAVPELQGRAKTTVRLHPRPGHAPSDASKIGGTFLWPAELADAWPRCREHLCPLVPALQLRKEDVPEVGFPPHTDLFQVLWCPHYVHANTDRRGRARDLFGPAPETYWWKRADIRRPLDFDPQPPNDNAPVDYALILCKPCVLYPERVVEYPDSCELWEEGERLLRRESPTPQAFRFDVPTTHPHWPRTSFAVITRLRESHELERALHLVRRNAVVPSDEHPRSIDSFYQFWLSAADGTKVGGYPDWIHFPEYPVCSCGATMELLVDFASTEVSTVSWGRWLPIEDRAVVGAGYDDERRGVEMAAGWCFGDMGRLYLFICRRCKGWPTRYVLQCS